MMLLLKLAVVVVLSPRDKLEQEAGQLSGIGT
jgi:hypothetical protein